MRLARQRMAQEWRADYRAGQVASAVANAFGGKKGGGQFGPEDFFPSLAELGLGQAQQEMTLEESEAEMTRLFGAPDVLSGPEALNGAEG